VKLRTESAQDEGSTATQCSRLPTSIPAQWWWTISKRFFWFLRAIKNPRRIEGRAGNTVANGFTLLYEVTACCAFNDSTPIPCEPLSHAGADTPVKATVSIPARTSILSRPVCCATARRRRRGGTSHKERDPYPVRTKKHQKYQRLNGAGRPSSSFCTVVNISIILGRKV